MRDSVRQHVEGAMTQSPFSTDELRALADVACDSTLTEDDVAQLERLLSGNVEAQQFYLAHVCLDTWLRSQLRARHGSRRHPGHLLPLPFSPTPSTAWWAVFPQAGRWRIWWQR